MALLKCFLKNSALLALAAAQALALQLPVGTEIQIRLKSRIGSKVSQPGDSFEAQVIAQCKELVLRGVARRIFSLPRKRELVAGSEHMAMRIDRAFGQFEARL